MRNARIWNVILFSIVLILISLLVDKCNLQKDGNQAIVQILDLKNKNNALQKTIDENNREITKATNVILEKDKRIEAQLKEIEQLKSLEQKVIIRNKTKFDTLTIHLNDTLWITDTDTIYLKSFAYKDEWLVMSGSIQEQIMTFDSLVVKNKYTIEIGKTREKWYKPKESVIYLRNENPYTKTDELVSYTLKPSKKWYERSGWKIAGASLLTYVLFKK